MFELPQLALVGLAYLLMLFGSAWVTDKGWIPQSVVRHTLTRTLAVGVAAGSLAFYASAGLAASFGGSYLLYFIGTSSTFLIAPVLINPLWRVAQQHKLGSLADVFAFRYPGAWVGGLVTVGMLLGVLPLIALQIHAVSVSIHLLNQDLSQNSLAVIFCIVLTLFAILFGARHVSTRDKHDGLVVAIALESVIKLVAMVLIAVIAVKQVFGDVPTLVAWLGTQEAVSSASLSEGSSRTLLLLFFAGAVAMPHVYHMLITENSDDRVLAGIRWGAPLYLLVMSLSVAPVVWAATSAGVDTAPEFFSVGLGLHLQSPTLATLAFIGGLAAASGVLVVTTLALASMTLNHIILPFMRPERDRTDLTFLLNARHALIAGTILAAYVLYRTFDPGQDLMSLGLMAFVAVLQFLPGLIGAFIWPRASRQGFVAGLIAGFSVWGLTLLQPLLHALVPDLPINLPALYALDETAWDNVARLSLSINVIAFVIVSLVTHRSTGEVSAAEECMSDSITRPFQGDLVASSVDEIREGLAVGIGRNGADRTVDRALRELDLQSDEKRPYALKQVREQMEKSLSSFLGQTIAQRIVNRFVPIHSNVATLTTESVHTIEARLEDYQSQLTGLARELDKLRRYHRRVLQVLPSAVCTVGGGTNIQLWNDAMEAVTGLPANRVVGSSVSSLPAPWKHLLTRFLADESNDTPKVPIEMDDGEQRLLNLHKATIDQPLAIQSADLVIVIEDVTDNQRMQDRLLHNERLASIGQLAAGVAHEIGNPITGIACLAQNLKLETEQEELTELADEILTQTERVSTILHSLVNFAHSGRDEGARWMMRVPVAQCVDEAIRLVTLDKSTKPIEFRNQCDELTAVEGDPQRLAQVFVNLLTNARDACSANSRVTVSTRTEREGVIVEVEDEGDGIDQDQLDHVFDPFFTTKTPGSGTGMGLAIVNTIIQEHRAEISAVSPRAPGQGGTRVIMRFPHFNPAVSLLTSPSEVVLSSRFQA